MKNLFAEAQNLQDELISVRRKLHKNPEAGMNLPFTSALVKENLEAIGFRAQIIGTSGLVATLGGGKSVKCVLLRADMDALPITEETALEFKSTNGCMHACGHDFHTAMLLGAARILKNHAHEINGTVKFMFQAGEEIMGGAVEMIENGVLDSPKVDAAIMLHVFAGLPSPCGTIVVPSGGVFTAAANLFSVTVTGKGGHGAMPENCIDPIFAANQLYAALQSIISREIPPSQAAVISAGSIHAGDSYNTIPDTCRINGTVRTYDKRTQEFILRRMQEMCGAYEKAFRVKIEIDISPSCPSVLVDGAVSDCVRSGLQTAFGKDAVVNPRDFGCAAMSFSEDFSFIAERVPSVMLLLAAGNPAEGYAFSQHHAKVLFNEEVLAKGAAAYAVSALSYLAGN